MDDSCCYENYPVTTVIVSASVSLLIYGISAFVLLQYGALWAVAYLVVAVIMEARLISSHCPDCYYFGKTCAFGKGRLSACLFTKGDPARFSRMQLTWQDIVPVFLMFIIPALAGLSLIVREFSVTILVLVALLFVLGFAGNAFVRGRLACRFCRQREAGCPAEQLFRNR